MCDECTREGRAHDPEFAPGDLNTPALATSHYQRTALPAQGKGERTPKGGFLRKVGDKPSSGGTSASQGELLSSHCIQVTLPPRSLLTGVPEFGIGAGEGVS